MYVESMVRLSLRAHFLLYALVPICSVDSLTVFQDGLGNSVFAGSSSSPFSESSGFSSSSYGSGSRRESPTFHFLRPKGIRINVPNPDPSRSPHRVLVLVNMNREIVGKTADWKGEEIMNSAREWSFTLNGATVTQGTVLYYRIIVTFESETTNSESEYSGSYTVSEPYPHGTESSPPSQKTEISSIYTNFGCRKCSSPEEFFEFMRNKNEQPSQELNLYEYNKKTTTPTTTTTAAKPTTTTTTAKPTTTTTIVKPTTTTTTAKPTTTTTTVKPTQSQVQSCKPTSSLLNGKAMCAGETTWLKKVNTHQYVGSNPEGAFTVFYDENVKNDKSKSVLSCIPTTLESIFGPYSVDRDLTLDKCSAVDKELCHYSPASYLITPPVMGCRIITETQLTVQYVTLEVKAKLPAGDWIVSEITLEPVARKYGNRSGRIVVARSRGNSALWTVAGTDYSNRVLEAGIELADGPYMLRKISKTSWSEDYHIFKVIWTPDRLQFMVDDKLIGRIIPPKGGLDPYVRGSKLAPFDKHFYLQIGVHVGGNRDFPDDLKGKPWKNFEPKDKLKFWLARDQWLPTWGENSNLLLGPVIVKAHE